MFTLVSSLRSLLRPLRYIKLVRVYSPCYSSILTSITSSDFIRSSISVPGIIKYSLTIIERKLVGLLGSLTT